VAAGGADESPAERIKVQFILEQDDDGWPPAGSEDIWAIVVASDVVKVDSIPWFVRDVALGDLISVQRTHDGRAVFHERLKWSGNCTLRVVPLADDSDAGIRDVIERLSGYGVGLEVLGQFGLVAVNVPASIDVVGLKATLDLGEKEGWWTYEEGCVGGAWPE